MIVAGFGIPGLTGMELCHMLNQLGLTYAVVHRSGLTKHASEVKGCKQTLYPVVFHSAQLFLQTHRKFKNQVVALVLDNAFVLERELSMPLLGVQIDRHRVVYRPFEVQDLKEVLRACVGKTEPQVYERKHYSPVAEILSRYAGSDLSKLQTFLYRIKDVEKRNMVGRMVKSWLVSGRPLSSLENELSKKIDQTGLAAIKVIVQAPSIPRLRDAVARAQKKPTQIDKIAKAMRLSPFDIRYLLSTK